MESHHKSYQSILKSASLLGGARAMTMLIGLVTVKFIALLIGPTGVGLIGTYEVMIAMAIYIFGLGIHSSGVRQVAMARIYDDQEQIMRTLITLRRLAWSLGLIGTLTVAPFAWPIGHGTFKDSHHGLDILILAPVILLNSIYLGSVAILRGFQRIGDLAKLTVITAFIQTAAISVFVCIFGQRGIAVGFVASALLSLIMAGYMMRNLQLPAHRSQFSWAGTWKESGAFIKLGLGMTNALMLSTLVVYATRTLIARDLGLAAVGIYLCAYNLSGKFIGFLLDAMQTDFYPRLSTVAQDHESLNRLVNQQTEIVLLMAIPGLLATLTVAPWLVRILYSSEFDGATVLLRWFILGCLARVIWAPIGYVQLAKGRGLLYFASEALINSTSLALTFVLLKNYGLRGAAASYLVSNILQIVVLAAIARRITGFVWSANSMGLLLSFSAIATVCVLASIFLPEFQATVLSALATVAVSIFCVQQLVVRLGPDHRLSKIAARMQALAWPI